MSTIIMNLRKISEMRIINRHIEVLIIIVTIFSSFLFSCRNNHDRKKKQELYTNFYNVNIDSLIVEAIPLDSINGTIYISNTNCSKCIVELIQYIHEISRLKIEDELYLATTDTLMLKYILQNESRTYDSITNRFTIIYLKNKNISTRCNGYIIKNSKPFPYSYKKYQPGYLDKMFNL